MPETPGFTPPEAATEPPKIIIPTEVGSKPRERLNYEKKARLEDIKARIAALEDDLRTIDELDKGFAPDRDARAEEYKRIDDERKALTEEKTSLLTEIDEKGWEKIAKEEPTEEKEAVAEETPVPEAPTPESSVPEAPEGSYAPTAPGEAPYAPEAAPYAPYAPYAPVYEPLSYTPSSYYSPEIVSSPDFQARALEEINALVRRDDARARERFQGRGIGRLCGALRMACDRIGHRRIGENLEEAGVWENHPKWRKWAKIGAKIAGGLGTAAAMVFTGGAGAILTPTLWSAGLREGIDGVLQAGEELGWGKNRSRLELEIQAVQSAAIDTLKARVLEGSVATEEEFRALVEQMLAAEQQVIGRQETNIRGERKGALIRGITSTVAVIGAGIFAGVPLGTHDLDKGATPVGWNGVQLDEAHRVMYNLHGGHFLYNNPNEIMRVANEVQRVGETALPWTQHFETWGAMSHTLGGGITGPMKIGLAAAAGYLGARLIEPFLGRKRKRATEPYSPSTYGPSYAPRGGEGGYYGAEGGYFPSTGPEGSYYHTPEEESGSFHSYIETMAPEYRRELELIAEHVGPMSEHCRMSVCIPTVYSEHPRIYHALEQYLNQKDVNGQPLAPETFEVNIFGNGPDDKGEDLRKMENEVKRFKHDHPEMRVNFYAKYLRPESGMGEIRKHVTDLAVLRAANREKSDGGLVLVSNDADVVRLDKDYIARGVEAFDSDPRLEMVGGKDDYPPEDYKKYPYLMATRRLWQFVDIMMRHRKYSDCLPKTTGANSFVRASAYTRIGGFRPGKMAEDFQLASDVAGAYGSQSIQYRPIKLETNPRRDIATLEQGKTVVQAYTNFGMQESFRESQLPAIQLENLSVNSPEFQKRLEAEASATYNDLRVRFFNALVARNPETIRRIREQGRNADVSDIRNGMWQDPAVRSQINQSANAVFDRAMRLYGASYDLEVDDSTGDARIKFTDLTRLRQGIERYIAQV